MSFADLLKKPLPSKVVQESAEEVEEVKEVKELTTEADDGNITDNIENELDNMDKVDVKTEDSDKDDVDEDDVDDLDDIDLSDLTDEELEEMEAELRDSDLDDAAGDVEPVELSAEEEREADDLMSLAGTTELIRSELSAEEQNEFFESAQEMQIAVFEGFLLESDIIDATDTDDVVTEKTKMATKNITRRTAEAWKNMLYAIAVNVSARAHNDPDFIKLQKVQKIRRVLRRKLQKKYHAEAIKRMKVYFNRLRSSKSKVLSNLGKKIDTEEK